MPLLAKVLSAGVGIGALAGCHALLDTDGIDFGPAPSSPSPSAGGTGPGGAGSTATAGGATATGGAAATGGASAQGGGGSDGGAGGAPGKTNGAPCQNGAECASGHCADGVCCDASCDGSCVSCLSALTGVADGTCAPVPDWTDPEDDCQSPQACTMGACGSPTGAHVWSTSFPTADFNGEGFGRNVAVGPAGEVVVAGQYVGTMSVAGQMLTSGNGSYDVFVVKLDAAGSLLWAKSFGSTIDDDAAGVAIDAQGNVVLAATVGGAVSFGGPVLSGNGGDDVAVVKLDASGTHVWSKLFGNGLDQTAEGVAVAANGDVLATGYFFGAMTFGATTLTNALNEDAFVARLAGADGTPLWARRFGSSVSGVQVRGNAVAVAPDGDVLATGAFEGLIDFGAGTLGSQGGFDVYVVELSGATGATVWAKPMGGTGTDRGLDVAVASDGRVVVGGEFTGTASFGGGSVTSAGGYDGFLVVLDAAGKHLSSRVLGGASTDRVLSADVGPGGYFVAGGSFNSPSLDAGGAPIASQGSYDVFVAKYAADGEHAWSKGFGPASNQMLAALAVDQKKSDIALTGSFSPSASFGGALLTTVTEAPFVVKLAP
jgi:hypothetical protein